MIRISTHLYTNQTLNEQRIFQNSLLMTLRFFSSQFNTTSTIPPLNVDNRWCIVYIWWSNTRHIRHSIHPITRSPDHRCPFVRILLCCASFSHLNCEPFFLRVPTLQMISMIYDLWSYINLIILSLKINFSSRSNKVCCYNMIEYISTSVICI